tara:strand:+ start:444 stop:1385 length:942 start_codon:yes stop_codon:yes gene_type:complete
MIKSDEKQVEISIVSPVYKAELLIKELVRQIKQSCEDINKSYEIILVDDGSDDGSWEAIKKECKRSNNVRGIKLSRNFGQHIAIMAGLRNIKGNWIVVMDCDLQDNPQAIPALYKKAKEGYSIVRARRNNRQHSFLKKLSSKVFYLLFEYLTGSPQDSRIANFGIYHATVIDAINKINDKNPYFPSQINWVGFSKYDLNITHLRRTIGKSSYSLKKLINLAFNNILTFSDKPLKLTIYIGFIISSSAFLLGIINFIMALLGIFTVSGFASIIITLLFSTGIIVFVIGIVGLYIGRIFESSKNRPLFIIEDKRN